MSGFLVLVGGFLYIDLQKMSNSTVHVTNLPRNTTEESVHDLFITFGPIEQVLVKDDIRNKGHKYANVKFKDAYDASQAILNINGFEYFDDVLLARELEDNVFESRSKDRDPKFAVWNQSNDQEGDDEQ